MPASTKPKPKKIGRPKLPKGEAKGRIVPVRFSADEVQRISETCISAGLRVERTDEEN